MLAVRVLLAALVATVQFARVLAWANDWEAGNNCTIQPLGEGLDDTDQIEGAIARCGHYGTTVISEGVYNVTRKMMWDLVESRVDLHGYLNFTANLPYWMNPENTYRVVYIQDQASWFVVTGRDFTIDAHNSGGIIGNGQYWWNWYGTTSRLDGDGRPIAFTLWRVLRGVVKDFRIEGQPFWCNTVAESQDVVYDGMYCNATNTNPEYYGHNVVPNTDGIDTFRADNVTMLNWDITLGDDCLAIKGNSTNIYAQNITCRGGNGIAFGSLGQYANLFDHVENVTLEDIRLLHIDPEIQPNMGSAVYFKSWSGTAIGHPPDNGGGGSGLVTNVTVRNAELYNVSLPIHVYQTNGAHPGDSLSTLQFADLSFYNFTGTSSGSTIVNLACSPAAPCPGMVFEDINITVTNGAEPHYVCSNVVSQQGLSNCSTTTP
ncbi:pectin lyase fold/virulence factor [Rhodofomes roseus]|uniref:galacturonan 1,4-alpha-galacturonidase n=1 Tax=Rhodofomes roseus TaxID=34475 RepID=A0ABQ8JYV3_9APHY|nr:pectin lyase fold/virulence factor [Rhodofomes roseus]KAH9829221.1 pectin lyase fold/virulence factor [Rhodofomes roseus]